MKSKHASPFDYPFSPDATWRIALSRRYRDKWTDDLYREVLFPRLSEAGILLECIFAGEGIDDTDYWGAQIGFMLEIADIHVLVVESPSGATRIEYLKSRTLAYKHIPTISTSYFDLAIELPDSVRRQLFIQSELSLQGEKIASKSVELK